MAWNTGQFSYLRAHPQEARLFDAMMAAFPDDRHAAIASAYDFSSVRVVCDVGGGDGAALRQICSRFPECRGLVFDLNDVVRSIPQDKAEGGRITVAGGSFFDIVPSGADVYLMVRVLHNWSDRDCLRILSQYRAAIEHRPAKLLLGEEILEPDPARGHAVAYLTDMQMMAMFGTARARTESEFASLLSQSGFELQRVISTASSVSVIEAAAI